ncbi:hypothetical protein ACFC1I_13870 [Microbacterium sp. NPDC056044]|uniref:hypothetical protein n=1 Tax=Microbacterium sp. NPDC056044 TaxID=3345690 RepID=UPI0035D65028
MSVGDDSWIETIGGRRAFKVDRKVARIRDTLVIRDVAGNEVAKVQERKIAIRDTMAIERPGDPTRRSRRRSSIPCGIDSR